MPPKERRVVFVGINVRVQKSPKPTDIVVAEAKLERDLKSCMADTFTGITANV